MSFRYLLLLFVTVIFSKTATVSADEAGHAFRLGASNNDAAVFRRVFEAYHEQIKEGADAWNKAGWEELDFSKLPQSVKLDLPQADGKLSIAELRDATLILGVGSADGQFHAGGAVMISPNGLALTNYHIAANFNNKIVGMTTTGRTAKLVKVLAGDPAADVAVVQFEGDGFPWIPVASQAPEVGDDIVMMHHTENRYFTYDRGYVKRYPLIGATPWMEISADYGQGGSGCGIFNIHHDLVGLVALIIMGDGPSISHQEAFPSVNHQQNEPSGTASSGGESQTQAPPSSPLPGALVAKFAVPLTAIQLLTQSDAADESSTAELQQQTSLQVGMQAPDLVDTKWLQGEPVGKFKEDKVYVVEFWATWCGPCIKAMPHLDELSSAYKNQGLRIVAMTTANASNPVDRIEKFVDARGKDFGFSFAMCETDSMELAYMKAANRDSIPSSFVIDKKGKVAFIGHPKDLDVVLEKIFNGTWNGEESARELEALEGKFAELQKRIESEPEEALTQMAAIEEQFPHVSKSPAFHVDRIAALVRTGEEKELKACFETAFELIKEKKNAMYMIMLGACLSDPQGNAKRICIEEAKAALEAGLAMDTADDIVVFLAAQAYTAIGEPDKGIQLLDRAIEKAGDSPETQLLKTIKDQIEEAAKQPERAAAGK